MKEVDNFFVPKHKLSARNPDACYVKSQILSRFGSTKTTDALGRLRPDAVFSLG
jgi:hypothetical protein